MLPKEKSHGFKDDNYGTLRNLLLKKVSEYELMTSSRLS